MKRFGILLIAALLGLVLACGSKEEKAPAKPAAPPAATAPAPKAPATPVPAPQAAPAPAPQAPPAAPAPAAPGK